MKGDNSTSYWLQPGYLHRLYMLDNPILDESGSLGSIISKTREILSKLEGDIRKDEDSQLTAFGNALGLDNNTPANAFKFLQDVVADFSDALMELWGAWASNIGRGGGNKTYWLKGGSGDWARQLAVDVAEESLVGEAQKDYSGEINNIIQELSDGILGVVDSMLGERKGRMAVSRPATAIGNFFDLYATAKFRKALEVDIKTDKFRDYINDNAVEGTKKSLRTINTSKETNSGTTRLGTYDVAIDINGEELLKVQNKVDTTGKQIATLLKDATFEEIWDTSYGEAAKDFIRFAIIHQHYFSLTTYTKKVGQVADRLGISGTYVTGSNPNAIEQLDISSAIPQLNPAILMLQYSAAAKIISGNFTGGSGGMFYLTGNVSGAQSHIIRSSDMISAVKNGESDRLSVYGRRKSILPMDREIISEYDNPMSREEWYNIVGNKLEEVLDKIEVTLRFDYSGIN